MYFKYGEKELNFLKNKDKKMKYAIEELGFVKRDRDVDIYIAIIKAMIGQQISIEAAKTVYNNLKLKVDDIKAESIVKLNVEDIQSCGMTLKKAGYIIDFTNKVLNNEFELEELRDLEDSIVIKKLCEINGIGEWTAEMLLANTLERKDIFSYKDIAIHRGLRMLYGHKEISKELFEKYRKRYSPYGTVASIYLWAIAKGAIPSLNDPKNRLKKS